MSEEEGQGWRAPGGPPSPSQPPKQDITPDHIPGGENRTTAPAPGPPPAAPWAAPGPSTAPPGWAPPGARGGPPPAPPSPAGATAIGADAAQGAAALRPYSLGDLLNGGFAYLRDNPRTVLGLSFVVVALTSVLPALGLTDLFAGYAALLRSETASPSALGMSGLGTASFYAGVLLQSVGSGLLLGLLSTVAAAAVLGRRTSLREAVAALRGRWGSLLALVGFYLAFSLVALAALGVVFLIATLLLLLVPFAGLPLFFLLFAGYAALFGWLAVKTSLAVPVAVLERTGPGHALVRSWRLSANNFWRMAGTLVLAHLLAYVITNVLSVPFSLGALLVGTPLTDLSLAAMLGVMLAFLGMLVTGCVSEPFTAGVTTLLYLDVRMRREGLDLRLREAARSGANPGPESLASPAALGAAV